MKYLMWLLKAAIFFTLFAFALNNQQTVAVHFFFGTFWQAPLVLVVLAAFAGGLALGIFGLTQGFSQIPYGLASDRFGRKRVMTAGLALFATGSILAALAPSSSSILRRSMDMLSGMTRVSL